MIAEQYVEATVEATCRSAGNIDLSLIKSKGATPLASITMSHKRILKKTVLRSLDNDPRVLKMDLEATRSANPGLYHYHRNGQSAECGLVPLIQGSTVFWIDELGGWVDNGGESQTRRTL